MEPRVASYKKGIQEKNTPHRLNKPPPFLSRHSAHLFEVVFLRAGVLVFVRVAKRRYAFLPPVGFIFLSVDGRPSFCDTNKPGTVVNCFFSEWAKRRVLLIGDSRAYMGFIRFVREGGHHIGVAKWRLARV